MNVLTLVKTGSLLYVRCNHETQPWMCTIVQFGCALNGTDPWLHYHNLCVIDKPLLRSPVLERNSDV